jgi:hypothetical protein
VNAVRVQDRAAHAVWIGWTDVCVSVDVDLEGDVAREDVAGGARWDGGIHRQRDDETIADSKCVQVREVSILPGNTVDRGNIRMIRGR